jgi:hypothetical protein
MKQQFGSDILENTLTDALQMMEQHFWSDNLQNILTDDLQRWNSNLKETS